LTGREPGEIKILVRDSVPFPFLERDERGYVICLPNLKKLESGILKYQGMIFDPKDESQIQILWNLFKSSAYYLSLFTVVYDPAFYSDVLKGKEENSAFTAALLVEDAVLNAYLKTFHPDILPEMKVADAISYLMLKPAHLIRNRALRLAASILSLYKAGMIKGRLEGDDKDARNSVNMLRRLERRNIWRFSKLNSRLDAVKGQDVESKRKTFLKIYDLLSGYSPPLPEVPSLPYMNHLSRTTILEEKTEPPAGSEIQEALNEIKRRLGLKLQINYEALKNEASQNFWDWLMKEKAARKILARYREMGQKTRFKDFVFPDHDYAEFLRRKAVHSKTIRRITNRLVLYYNLPGEDFRKETGIIDLQEAIQVIASQQQRSDIFQEDTLRYRAQAWSILVDVSLSLESFSGEVKDVILCLTEVSRKLFSDNRSLGVFAFDDKFYIIKDFMENHNRTVCARIGGIRHRGLTYLADGIRMATEALKRRYEESKILIVVSDGFPMGYRGAAEEAKEEINAALNSGIHPIGIGIDSRGIRDYFPIYCIVRTPYELMKKFVDTFFSYSSMM
jgi:hypothetical protein